MSHMKKLYNYLKEGLLNKNDKSRTVSQEEVLVEAMTLDWPAVLGVYSKFDMPIWAVEIKNREASISGKNTRGEEFPVRVPIGTHVLTALKNLGIKKLVADTFALGDWKTRNTIKELSNIILHSTYSYPNTVIFNFKGNWKLENVTLKSDRDVYPTDYYGYNRSLIIGRNVKLENGGIDIHDIGDTETLCYDYSDVTKFSCTIPSENPLSTQIMDWLEQKKEGTARDEDLKKLLGDIPRTAESYEYLIKQDNTWNIHMKIYSNPIFRFNMDTPWDWCGLHIQAYRQRGANGQTFHFMDNPNILVYSKHKIKR